MAVLPFPKLVAVEIGRCLGRRGGEGPGHVAPERDGICKHARISPGWGQIVVAVAS